MKDQVKLLLLGDSGVGKTTLISAYVSRRFPDPNELQRVLADTVIPSERAGMKGRDVLVTIVDSERDDNSLRNKIRQADSILLLYDTTRIETLDSLLSYWLPLVKAISEEDSSSDNKVLLPVGTKTDLLCFEPNDEGEQMHQEMLDREREKLKQLVDEYSCDLCERCSAKALDNVDKVFHFAELLIAFPLSPIYDSFQSSFTPSCKRAFRRFFRIVDTDRDGLLSDEELNSMQRSYFGGTLSKPEIEELKEKLRRGEKGSSIIESNKITFEGFLRIMDLYVDSMVLQVPWTLLKRVNYDEVLTLRLPRELVEVETFAAHTELSEGAIKFLEYIVRTARPASMLASPRGFSAVGSPRPQSPDFPSKPEADFPARTSVRAGASSSSSSSIGYTGFAGKNSSKRPLSINTASLRSSVGGIDWAAIRDALSVLDPNDEENPWQSPPVFSSPPEGEEGEDNEDWLAERRRGFLLGGAFPNTSSVSSLKLEGLNEGDDADGAILSGKGDPDEIRKAASSSSVSFAIDHRSKKVDQSPHQLRVHTDQWIAQWQMFACCRPLLSRTLLYKLGYVNKTDNFGVVSSNFPIRDAFAQLSPFPRFQWSRMWPCASQSSSSAVLSDRERNRTSLHVAVVVVVGAEEETERNRSASFLRKASQRLVWAMGGLDRSVYLDHMQLSNPSKGGMSPSTPGGSYKEGRLDGTESALQIDAEIPLESSLFTSCCTYRMVKREGGSSECSSSKGWIRFLKGKLMNIFRLEWFRTERERLLYCIYSEISLEEALGLGESHSYDLALLVYEPSYKGALSESVSSGSRLFPSIPKLYLAVTDGNEDQITLPSESQTNCIHTNDVDIDFISGLICERTVKSVLRSDDCAALSAPWSSIQLFGAVSCVLGLGAVFSFCILFPSAAKDRDCTPIRLSLRLH